jgi:hypothetical protein
MSAPCVRRRTRRSLTECFGEAPPALSAVCDRSFGGVEGITLRECLPP